MEQLLTIRYVFWQRRGDGDLFGEMIENDDSAITEKARNRPLCRLGPSRHLRRKMHHLKTQKSDMGGGEPFRRLLHILVTSLC